MLAISKLYSKHSWIYKIFYEKHFNYSLMALLVEKHLKKYHVKTILHVGSGPGHLTKLLTDKNFNVTGIDNSQEMISMARKRNHNVKFIRADMRKIKLNEKFDAIVLMGRTFTYMVADEDVSACLSGFYKVG